MPITAHIVYLAYFRIKLKTNKVKGSEYRNLKYIKSAPKWYAIKKHTYSKFNDKDGRHHRFKHSGNLYQSVQSNKVHIF